ncbi:MAG: Cytochrome c55X precursor NirC [Pseudomonadota bacterium]
MNKYHIIGFLFLIITTIANALSTPRQIELKSFLEQDCGSCHGMTLQGGLGTPLTSEALINKTNDYLKTIILYGKPNTAMPAWKSLLTEEEVDFIIQMLRQGK